MKRWIVALGVLAITGCYGGGGGGYTDPGAVDLSGGPAYAIYPYAYVQYPNGHPLAARAPDSFTLTHENELATLINDHRTALGLNPLILDSTVADVARAHSIHMALHDFAGTINPEGDRPADRASLVGLVFWQYQENVDAGSVYASTVFSHWLSDQITRARMEDPTWTTFGAGYFDTLSSTYGTYWTVDFLRK